MIYWFTGASTQAVTTGAYRAVEFIKQNIKLEGVEKASVADSKRVVEIPLHLGLLDIAKRLDAAGVIRSPMGFTLLAVVRGSARSLKAGEYEMPAGATTRLTSTPPRPGPRGAP